MTDEHQLTCDLDDECLCRPREWRLVRGDALDLMRTVPPKSLDLVATDPPYAFGGSGEEHAVSATVAVVLREAALRLKVGGWMIVFAASSWRSTAYMVEAVRGILDPVRVATWVKPGATSKTRTPGWRWATVNVLAMRRGKSRKLVPSPTVDYIEAAALKKGRRAQLPSSVADWAVSPFVVPGGHMLDPFAGSGALPAAAAALGMNATGFEKDPRPDEVAA